MQKLKLKKDLPGFGVGTVFLCDEEHWSFKKGENGNYVTIVSFWLGRIIDEFQDDQDWFEKLPVEPELPQSWEELGKIEGYWIDEESKVLSVTPPIDTEEWHENLFKTKKQAESALAYAQLTQLMAVYNDGWEPDWSDPSQSKYTIQRQDDDIVLNCSWIDFQFLTLKNEKTAETFMEAPEIEKLIRQFYMIEVGDE